MPPKVTTVDTQNEHETETDFVLKHRIVGAAFLLFFGALFLPWLLGAPGNAPHSGSVPSDDQGLSKQIEAELIKAVEKEKLANQEQVYISRITPVGTSANNKESTTSAPKPKPAPKKTVNKPAPVVKPVDKDKGKKVVISVPKSEPSKASNTVAEKVEKTKPTPSTAKAKEVAPKKQPKPVSVDVGWIVSVGVFSDKKNVTAVLKDLKRKGFKPSTSEMQTSKGLATRVWLGPFAERVEAAKSKTMLKQQTGEPGLIKAYP